MSARNGAGDATLALLRVLGRATSSQLAQRLGAVGADVVLGRLCNLERAGKVMRVGTIATGKRPVVLWAATAPREDGAPRGSIAAANSDEFLARGGFVQVLPAFPDRMNLDVLPAWPGTR